MFFKLSLLDLPCLTELSCCSQHTCIQIHFKLCPFVFVFILCSSHLQGVFYITIYFSSIIFSGTLYFFFMTVSTCDCGTLQSWQHFPYDKNVLLSHGSWCCVFRVKYEIVRHVFWISIITPACMQTIWLLEQARSLFDFLLGLNICFRKCHSKLLITLSFFSLNTLFNIQCMSEKMLWVQNKLNSA